MIINTYNNYKGNSSRLCYNLPLLVFYFIFYFIFYLLYFNYYILFNILFFSIIIIFLYEFIPIILYEYIYNYNNNINNNNNINYNTIILIEIILFISFYWLCFHFNIHFSFINIDYTFSSIIFNLSILVSITFLIGVIHKLLLFTSSAISFYFVGKKLYKRRIGFYQMRHFKKDVLANIKSLNSQLFNINYYLNQGLPINNIILGVALERLEHEFGALAYNYKHYTHWRNQYIIAKRNGLIKSKNINK